MSMISYAAGARYLQLLGGACGSFYDWYCDLPPASPQTWGEQTDVAESADWYNSSFMLLWGSNVPQTRTPDAHFYTEARYRGARVAAVAPDYAEYVKFADTWLPARAGTLAPAYVPPGPGPVPAAAPAAGSDESDTAILPPLEPRPSTLIPRT
jgi:nitrate reductase alpha subunit